MATRKEQQQNTLVTHDAADTAAAPSAAPAADTALAQAKPATSFERATHRAIRGARTSVFDLLARGEIAFPEDYNVANALNAAALVIQRTVDMNKKPALQVCTETSIQEALIDMVLMGLNPAKKQGYFIVFGNQLGFMPSYHGDVAVAKRVRPGISVSAQIIYEGDEVETEIVDGNMRVTKHTQPFASRAAGVITGAYAVLKDERGVAESTVLMTWREIQASWKQSKTYKPDGNGVHNRFPEAMTLRTVIRKLVTPIITQSDDAHLKRAVRRQDTLSTTQAFESKRNALANNDLLAPPDDDESVVEATLVDDEPEARVVDEDTGEVMDDLPAVEMPGEDPDDDDWKD